MTDDLSVPMLDLLLENNMMPNLQTYLIDEGTTFNNSFVTASLCCPSRATFLTGLYPHNHGVFLNKPMYIDGKLFANGGFKAFDDSSTIATWLNDSNYKTGFVGKYLNDYHKNAPKNYVPPGWDDWQATLSALRMYNYGIMDNGKTIWNNKVYQTEELAKRAGDFIQESDSPFFLYVSSAAPHSMPDAYTCAYDEKHTFVSAVMAPKYNGTLDNIEIPHSPSFNENDVSDKPPKMKKSPIENIDCIDKVFRGNAESLLSVDDLIGSIYQSVAEKNLIDQTVFIFTSDNGFMYGEHRLVAKVLPYEESIRVPLIIRVPGLEKQTINNLVTNNDLAPTIADLAGIEPDTPVDGFSLLPILKNSKNNLRDGFLIEIPFQGGFIHAIRTNEFLYVEYDGKNNYTEFYDLKKDPYQLNNDYNCSSTICRQQIATIQKALSDLIHCGQGTCQILENKMNFEN